MNRRSFCKLMGGALAAGAVHMAWPGRPALAQTPPDLAAVQGGAPAARLAAALTALGGLERFLKPGQTVLIKPNAGWAVEPSGGANTDPVLVRALTELCLAGGAKKVVAFDHTCDQWERAYQLSGLEAAVKDGGGAMAPADAEKYYQTIETPGQTLTTVKVHELYLEADLIINFPVLKHHGGAGLTCAIKNLMGVVWDRSYYHRHGLDQCLADFAAAAASKVALNLVDAGRVMLSGGPRGSARSQFKRLDLLLAAPALATADAAAALSFGARPEDYDYIGRASAMGAGGTDLSTLNIQRLNI